MKRLLILLTVYGLAAQTPTGIVTFRDGATTLCSVPLAGGAATCPISTLSAGTHNLTATYGGDGVYAGSTSAWSQTVFTSGPAPIFTFSATGTVGQPFSQQLSANNSPTYSSTELPAGLSINPSTGLISGTPTVSGSFSAMINAANANGVGSIILNLTIAPAVVQPPGVSITSINPPSPTFGQSMTIIGSGFAPTQNFAWFSPVGGATFGQSLSSPTGTTLTVSLNASFRRGAYSVLVQNSSGSSNSIQFTIQ